MPIATTPDWATEPTGQVLADLSERRKQLKRHGPGRAVAVVVIDLQRFFVRDGDPVCDAAMAANIRLLERARSAGVPVVLVKNVFNNPGEINPCWAARGGGAIELLKSSPRSELHPALGQTAADIVVEKPHASGFTSSMLHDHLTARGIDTVLLTGTSTSGCVRATAVEGAARHYRMMVVEECVYEHRPISGPVSLYEMAERYADVISLEEAFETIDKLKRS
jgi:maleamate amidohydrolase